MSSYFEISFQSVNVHPSLSQIVVYHFIVFHSGDYLEDDNLRNMEKIHPALADVMTGAK